MHAARGRGCLVAGRRMTADRPAHRARLTGGVVLTEWAGPRPWPGMLDLLAALADRGATTRVMGSSTLALAHVAAGRCAGAVIGEFHPEDHLAATLLCAEAGCVVRGESGETELFPRRGGVLVAAPQVADELSVLWRAALEAQR
jgi:fructose-1,6-bisphosphatase/inositol monophosphatase family enzyme